MEQLTPFKQAAETSRNGFTSLLQVVQNELNFVKQKRLQRDQFEMEKEMVSFKISEQEKIAAPQRQVKAEADAIKDDIDQGRANIQARQDLRSEIPDIVMNKTPNLYNFPDVIRQRVTGQVENPEGETITLMAGSDYVQDGNNFIPRTEYVNYVNENLLPIANFVNTLETLLLDDGLKEEDDLGDPTVIGRQTAKELLTTIRSAPNIEALGSMLGQQRMFAIQGGAYTFNRVDTVREEVRRETQTDEMLNATLAFQNIRTLLPEDEFSIRGKNFFGIRTRGRRADINLAQSSIADLIRASRHRSFHGEATDKNREMAEEMRNYLTDALNSLQRMYPNEVFNPESIRLNMDVLNGTQRPEKILDYFIFDAPFSQIDTQENSYDNLLNQATNDNRSRANN